MATPEEIKRNILQQIIRLQSDEQDYYRDQLKALENRNATEETYLRLLRDVQRQQDSLSRSLESINGILVDNVNELRSQNEYITRAISSTRKLSNIAADLLSIRKGDSSYDKKKIENLKDEAKKRLDILKTTQNQFAIGSAERRSIEENISKSQELLESFKDLEEIHNSTNKKLGASIHLAGSLDKAMGKIGLPNLNLTDAIDEVQRLSQEAAATGDNSFNPLSAYAGILVGNLKEAFTTAKLITGVITFTAEAMKGIDEGAGEMAKSMNITYSEALKVRKELTGIANASYDTNVNTKDLQTTLLAVNQTIGARVSLTEKDLVTFTKMREQAGLANEEIYGIQQIATLNNDTLDKTNQKLLGAARAYAGKNKLAINEKEILKDVSKASDALKLSLGGSVEKLAESAIKARQFGLNLEQAEKMAGSLLEFESSIENELSAELLTGKNLNLERARALALNGDSAAAAAEVAKQMGNAADFSKMNVIQQEALAQSVGMNRDELAKSLMDQVSLQKMGAKEGQSAQERYNELRAQGLSQKAIEAKLGKDANADMYEQQSIQEKLNKTVEKLKEIFLNVGNALMPIFDTLSGIFDVVGPIVGAFGQLVSFMSPILKPMLMIWAALKGMSLVTKGMTSLNQLLIAQNTVMTTQTEGQVVAETTRLGLGQKILATLGLQDAVLVYQLAKESGLGTAAALRAAMEETILGSLVLQGANLVKNLGKYVLTTLQAGYRAVAESTILGSLIAQSGAMLKNIATGAIFLAQSIATSVAQIAGASAISLGAAAAIALAAGAAAYAFFGSKKGDDVMSPGGGSSGYGNRTLFGPEGAIQLNNKDTIIAGTDLFKKSDDMVSAPKGALSVSNKTSPKRETRSNDSGMGDKFDRLISAVNKRNEAAVLIQ